MDLTRSAVEEDVMHPYISQSLMDAQIADRHRAAAATRQARQARRARRARRAARQARRQRVTALPNPQPALEALPVADRALTH
ncbi:MAG TPA: hypothetical protein VK586_16535 [Streptosporangiaceae bacterium]|nr:hypothetical protein [Streptosporangiaceae bacterium]